ncbi:MAG TPA: hypothetical protein PKB10_09770, partial [Tepidisphaeraceae bacterium]|nr:hypothetical protein [Tepidisphaeraceae bacterium]
FHHRDALHYHLGSVEPGVLMLLTMRDPARTLDTTVGKSGSVRNGLDFVVPYVRGEKVHREWVNSQVDLDRRRFEQGDEYYRPGKPWTADYRARRLFELAGAIDPKYRDIARIIPARPDEIDVVFEYLINGR